jgi:hypothetical protein
MDRSVPVKAVRPRGLWGVRSPCPRARVGRWFRETPFASSFPAICIDALPWAVSLDLASGQADTGSDPPGPTRYGARAAAIPAQ